MCGQQVYCNEGVAERNKSQNRKSPFSLCTSHNENFPFNSLSALLTSICSTYKSNASMTSQEFLSDSISSWTALIRDACWKVILFTVLKILTAQKEFAIYFCILTKF